MKLIANDNILSINIINLFNQDIYRWNLLSISKVINKINLIIISIVALLPPNPAVKRGFSVNWSAN